MQLVTEVYVVTPLNVGGYTQAAKDGDEKAAQILQAVDDWADSIADRHNEQHCFNPSCQHRALQFNDTNFVPMAIVVLMSSRCTDALLRGFCPECSARQDFKELIGSSVRFLLDDSPMPSLAIN